MDIPDGYDVDKHRALACTIAEPGSMAQSPHVMACHESLPGSEMHCVGWLANQVGPGNNIPLRMRMMSCANAREIELVGDQHETLEDTLP